MEIERIGRRLAERLIPQCDALQVLTGVSTAASEAQATITEISNRSLSQVTEAQAKISEYSNRSLTQVSTVRHPLPGWPTLVKLPCWQGGVVSEFVITYISWGPITGVTRLITFRSDGIPARALGVYRTPNMMLGLRYTSVNLELGHTSLENVASGTITPNLISQRVFVE